MTPEDDTLGEGEEYFDLRKELEGVVLDEEMSLESKGGAGLLGENEHYSFEDVFDEFKKGVEKQFGAEDYDTHYNLGIAYREMGLFDDAIKSFNISVNDPKKRLDSFIMMGVTHRDMGEFDKSIDYFREALDTPDIKDDERHGLQYELALSYEADNDIEQAYPIYKGIFDEKPDFRDISDKVRALQGSVTQPVEEKREKKESKEGKQKDKISYV
jgi:tetratricopeptide (TPR) repeat protein